MGACAYACVRVRFNSACVCVCKLTTIVAGLHGILRDGAVVVGRGGDVDAGVGQAPNVVRPSSEDETNRSQKSHQNTCILQERRPRGGRPDRQRHPGPGFDSGSTSRAKRCIVFFVYIRTECLVPHLRTGCLVLPMRTEGLVPVMRSE